MRTLIRGAGDFHFCELMKHQQSNGPDANWAYFAFKPEVNVAKLFCESVEEFMQKLNETSQQDRSSGAALFLNGNR